MSLSYWPYVFQTAVYLINRMPTSTLNNQSPFEKLFKQMPNYLKLKQFGCLCYPLTRPYNKHKLEPKAQPCTFVGSDLSQNAYLCLEPTTESFHFSACHISRRTFPFQTLKPDSPSFLGEDPVMISLSQLLLVPCSTRISGRGLKSRHRLRMGHPTDSFPVSRHADGFVDQFKAKLVAKGFNRDQDWITKKHSSGRQTDLSS
ncbi:hypothetical protein AAG906_003782 [Vitis piasezkii]